MVMHDNNNKNRRQMGHITHLRNISQQYTTLNKAMIIQAGWLKVINILIIYLNSLHQWMYCFKFDWYWPSGSSKEDSINI